MKVTKLSLAMTLFLSLFYSAAVFAQVRQDPALGMGISSGFYAVDPAVDNRSMYDLQARLYLRYNIAGPFRGELSGAYGRLRHLEGFESNIYPVDTRILFTPLEGAVLSPYLFGGVGAMYFKERTDHPLASSGWTGILPAGAGLQIRLFDNVALDFNGGYHHLIGDNFVALENNNDKGFWGVSGGLTFLTGLAPKDSDTDGLLNSEEKKLGTDPNSSDSDRDGVSDFEEFHTYQTNPLLADSDGDGLDDHDEITVHKTNPNVSDSDNDGLSDTEEVNIFGTDPLATDSDSDDIEDAAEVRQYQTNPTVADTDGDGLKDGAEVHTHKTDPLKEDTDGDGLADGQEVTVHKTDPTLADSDNGTVSDQVEIERGSNPLDASDDVEKAEENDLLLGAGIGVPVVLDGVYFDLNSATIRPESEIYLQRVVETLQKHPETQIEIHGHTDSSGPAHYNLELSQRRANSVRHFLITHGVDPDRIIAKGFGESAPIASNATAQGRQKNRRIEFVRVK